MAELSDADKKILLGEDWKENQANQDASRGITDTTRSAAEKDKMASNIVTVASGFGIVALIIGIANYFSRGTPYNPALVIGCTIVVLASAATAAWFMRQRKSGG
jgi:hypothetical protein